MPKYIMKIIYHMATMPSRVKALHDSIPSILKQCDELYVYCNDFTDIPSILKHDKITVFKSDEHFGDLGDVGKFYNCQNWQPGYHFTTDDKIIYPDDYSQRTIEAIEQYNGNAVISWHGRILHTDRPCKSYYNDSKEMISLIHGTPIDRKLHVGGTGVMAFKLRCFKEFDLSVFPYINMTDIWFSLFLFKQNVDIIRPKSRDRWIKLSRNYDSNYAISATIVDDSIHTQTINTINWKPL